MARKTLARTKPAQRDAEAPARDWRTGRGYPPLTASASEFAWQFLRRNPEYRSDWKKFADDLRAAMPDFARWRLDESTPFYEAGSVRLARGAWATPLESALASKWGLSHLVDPACDVLPEHPPAWPRAVSVSYARWAFDAEEQQMMELRQPSELIVRIDLRTPRAPLMKLIGTLVERIRKELRIDVPEHRRRAREWITYLRLLDADEAGAQPCEIYAALWPRLSRAYPERAAPKKLNKALPRALELRAGGYIALPLLGAARRK